MVIRTNIFFVQCSKQIFIHDYLKVHCKLSFCKHKSVFLRYLWKVDGFFSLVLHFSAPIKLISLMKLILLKTV